MKSLGLMSGTSVDGSVSAAIIETDGVDSVQRIVAIDYRYEKESGTRAIHHVTKAAEVAYRRAQGEHSGAAACYEEALHDYVAYTFSLSGAPLAQKVRELSLEFLGSEQPIPLRAVIQRSTEVHILAARAVLEYSKLHASEIQHIGYHGQTLYHDPFFNHTTVQVGDPQLLADQLRIPVVFDFRTNDVKHGGQGAPLAPAYHRALVRSAGIKNAAVLNLGGTTNVTVVASDTDEMLGFDTGPANGLIDRYVKERAGIALDRDSHLAERGTVSEIAIKALVARAIVLKDGSNYLSLKPPKSLDIRDYTYDIPEFQVLSLEDGCATLNAFTAECVVLGIDWIEAAGYQVPTTWVLCGGGAFSPHLRSQLMQRLASRIQSTINMVSADDIGWSAQGMEAELFAYLAVRSVAGLPLTFPGTTGVDEPTKGGRVFYPR
jgi:anhydro-N-acetylmuramic acid kinase